MLPPSTERPKCPNLSIVFKNLSSKPLTLRQLVDEMVNDLFKRGSINSEDLLKVLNMLQEILGHV
jgi:hypothetical protein